jgi:hypothetical protein
LVENLSPGQVKLLLPHALHRLTQHQDREWHQLPGVSPGVMMPDPISHLGYSVNYVLPAAHFSQLAQLSPWCFPVVGYDDDGGSSQYVMVIKVAAGSIKIAAAYTLFPVFPDVKC